MKIIVVGQIPPPFHGSNIMTSIFLRGLDKNCLNYKFINKVFSKNSAEVESFRPIKIFRLLLVLFKTIYSIFSYKPDMLVYFFSAKKMGVLPDLLILYFSRLLGTHNVLYIHGIGHRAIYKNKLFKHLYNYVLRDKCTLIILSDALKSDVDYISKNIYALPNTIDMKQSYHPSINTNKPHNNKPLAILYLSNLIREKGLLELLQAFKEINSEKNSVKLIVGGGFTDKEFEHDVHEYINNNNLTDSVILKGTVYGDKKEELFLASDIFAFPSYYPVEAFPLVLLEAMSYGLPAIASDAGAIADIIDDSETGFVIKKHDIKSLVEKLDILVNNADLRNSFRENARNKFTENYSYDVYAAKQKEIIMDIYGRISE